MASGDTLLILRAGDGTPPATLSGGLTSIAGTSTPAERFTVVGFDDTTVEHWDYHLVMPQHYGGGGLTLRFLTGGAAASGNYVLSAAFRRIEDDTDDLDTTAHTYAYNDTSAITAPSVIGEVGYDSLTFTDGADMDSVAAGDAFVLRVRVNGGTIVGDTYLYRLEVRET
jgi:hypothetical protein